MFVQRANHPQVQHRAQAAAVFPFGADVAMNGRASERLLPLPLHEDPIQISFLNVIAIGRAHLRSIPPRNRPSLTLPLLIKDFFPVAGFAFLCRFGRTRMARRRGMQ